MKNNESIVFNQYENEIVNHLIHKFKYSENEARLTVRGYRSILYRIGLFEESLNWAFLLDKAISSKITPDTWHSILNSN